MHFLACEDVAGGSQQSRGESIIFEGKKDAVACMRPWVWCVPTVSLSRTVIFRRLSVVDHVDHTMPSAPKAGGRRRGPTLERPGDGEDAAVESQMERSGKLDWFGCAATLPRCRPREIGARTEFEEGERLLD